MRWLSRLLRPNKMEHELDKELRFHVDARVEELIGKGVEAGEARRRALAEFGGVEPIKESARDARGTRWVSDIGQDVRYALRMLGSNKAFSIAAILSLAVGIGANATVFRVINSLVLRPLDITRPDELFLVTSTLAEESRFSFPAFSKLADAASPSHSSLAAMTPQSTVQTTVNGATELSQLQLVSTNWFDTVDMTAAMGRTIGASDTSEQTIAVISDRFWTRKFGRNPSVLGSTIRVNGAPTTIVGIGKPGFVGLNVGLAVDVWMPITTQHAIHYRGNASIENSDGEKPWWLQDGVSWLTVIGRRPADTSESALAGAIGGTYQQMINDAAAKMENEGRRKRKLTDRAVLSSIPRGVSNLRDRLSPTLTLLMAMVGLALLVACANLANLLLARGAARSREFALRLAIGARRGRLVRQLLTESLTLAAIGGAAGFVLAQYGGTALLQLLSSTRTAPPMAMPFDARVIGFGVAVTLVTGVLFGLLPALRLSRPELLDAMKTGGRVVDSGRRGRVPAVKVLVAVQVAVSMLLVAGALVFFQTFANLVKIDAGFDRDTVVTARFNTRLAGYEPGDLPAIYARILEKARAVPGVSSAALGRVGPATNSTSRSSIVIPGYTPGPTEDVVVAEDSIGPGYVSTLGMKLLAGREITEQDVKGGHAVAIINDATARKWFGGTNAVGRTFGYGTDELKEIVGVVQGTRSQGLREDVPPFVYYALNQIEGEYVGNLYVRTTASQTDAVKRALKVAVESAAPEMAIREVVTMRELTERTVANERMVSNLTTGFGLLGVAVACLGLYGTIAYSVARRTNEIGVRLALGAEPGEVRWMVLKETIMLSIAGVVIGVLITLPTARLAESMVYGLSPRDPRTLLLSAIVVMVIGALAGAVPAWRASRVNPTAALRAD